MSSGLVSFIVPCCRKLETQSCDNRNGVGRGAVNQTLIDQVAVGIHRCKQPCVASIGCQMTALVGIEVPCYFPRP
jgi:hypothetical protein